MKKLTTLITIVIALGALSAPLPVARPALPPDPKEAP